MTQEIDNGQRKVVSQGTYRGVEYYTIRTSEDRWTNGFAYEFVLYIEGEDIITASQLENRGASDGRSEAVESRLSYEAPWIPVLNQYATAYIDGMQEGGR